MEELELIFLGTGTSQGVPIIGCDCETCKSKDPRDNRLRTSVLLRICDAVTGPTGELENISLLVDTPPDIRMQCLRENIRCVDAVLFTHAHTDHIMGFDDLRRFCEMTDSELPVYGVVQTLTDLQRIFAYVFGEKHFFVKNYMRALPKEIKGEFKIGNLRIVPVRLPHGRFITTGFVFHYGARKLLAYYTDCNAVPPEAEEAARGADALVLDALRHEPHPTHLTIEDAVAVACRIGARRSYFTHMSHDIKHAETEAALPPGILLAYDGLRLRL